MIFTLPSSTLRNRQDNLGRAAICAASFIQDRVAPSAPAGGGIIASRCYIHQRIGEWQLTTPLQFIEVQP